MSSIRVTYSGIISFMMGLVTLFTGLFFSLILTRSLSVEEYGAWGLIFGLIAYVALLEPIISFWTTREIARGIESGKTAIFSSGIISIIGILIYIVIASIVSLQSNIVFEDLLKGLILIPVIFIYRTITAVTLGYKPQGISYGTLVFGISQVLFSILFVFNFSMGVMGIIFSLTISYSLGIFFLIIYSKKKLTVKIDLKTLKKWFKLSWLPLYPIIGNLVFTLSIPVYTIIVGSVEGIAYWTAAVILSSLVSNASKISTPLYSKLLENSKTNMVKVTFRNHLYFAFPLVSISIVFAAPGLYALNPIYQSAIFVVILMSISTFLQSTIGAFQFVLSGIEKVDVNENSTYREFIKSNLFSVPTISLIQAFTFIISLVVGLSIFAPDHMFLDLLHFWALITVITQIPLLFYYYFMIKRTILSIFEISSIKYLFSTFISFGLTFLLVKTYLNYSTDLFEFIPSLLFFVLIGVALYIALTFVLDHNTRKLINLIFLEIKFFRN
jgi:O-antigen/teichoic acid export membrane protein